MAHPVVHFEVQAKNAASQQKFYADLFGWTIDANNPMNYGLVTTGSDRGIAGGIGDGQGAARVTFYVEVADLDAKLKEAEGMGAKTVMPPETVAEGTTIALFADPEGNVIGLSKASS